MMNKYNKKITAALLILLILCPLGLILPKVFHANGAWGEWSMEDVQKKLGFVPQGMKEKAAIYKAPLANYSFKGENHSLLSGSLGYFVSGCAALLIIGLGTWFFMKIKSRHD
jgi:cobalt/nickel transport protein